MQRNLIVVSTLLLVMACKKDYTCDCVHSNNGIVTDTTTQVFHATETDAKSLCIATFSSSTDEIDCTIRK